MDKAKSEREPARLANEDGEDSTTMEQAKRFLQDDQVRLESRERKFEFLKQKGLEDSQIVQLLHTDTESETEVDPKQDDASPARETKSDHPPIVTYPEFLTKPAKPPPLITMSGFLNTLYAFGGLSTLVYGTSKFVLAPMVESLTEARVELHGTAAQNLAKFIDKLEGMVSEIPPAARIGNSRAPDDEDGSSYGDPTELFHRDIGVQTSAPPSPGLSATRNMGSQTAQSATIRQSARVTDLVSSIRDISRGLSSQSGDYTDIQATLDLFSEDIDKLSQQARSDFMTGYSFYGNANRNEPDDEIKKAKENIKRAKGVLLSARSFPASQR